MLMRQALLLPIIVLFCNCAGSEDKPPQGTPGQRGWSGATQDEWMRAHEHEKQEYFTGPFER